MLLDTSAWIELFKGGTLGDKVSTIIQTESCHTCMVTIAEVVQWAERNGQNPDKLVEHIERLTAMINLDRGIAMLAGRLNFQSKKTNNRMGMIDSLILATGVARGERVLTTDSDFRGLPNTEILGDQQI